MLSFYVIIVIIFIAFLHTEKLIRLVLSYVHFVLYEHISYWNNWEHILEHRIILKSVSITSSGLLAIFLMEMISLGPQLLVAGEPEYKARRLYIW